MTDSKTGVDDLRNNRYLEAACAIQGAVAFGIAQLGEDGAGASPRHLRTGLNMVMADHASLVGLLVMLGVITDEQYMDAMVAGTESEAERAISDYRKRTGAPDSGTGR